MRLMPECTGYLHSYLNRIPIRTIFLFSEACRGYAPVLHNISIAAVFSAEDDEKLIYKATSVTLGHPETDKSKADPIPFPVKTW
jgi:hypothetical protein